MIGIASEFRATQTSSLTLPRMPASITKAASTTSQRLSAPLSPSSADTTSVTCCHAADSDNTCAAIADGPGWCECGTDPASFDCSTPTSTVCLVPDGCTNADARLDAPSNVPGKAQKTEIWTKSENSQKGTCRDHHLLISWSRGFRSLGREKGDAGFWPPMWLEPHPSLGNCPPATQGSCLAINSSFLDIPYPYHSKTLSFQQERHCIVVYSSYPMDHLPTPKNFLASEKTFVPYVCKKTYDLGPFLTYPVRECVTHALPLDGKNPGGSPYWAHERKYPTPKPEQEDFLQRWLFFGLIHEILGDRYKPEDHIRTIKTDEGESSFVSTLGLVETLDQWLSEVHGSVSLRHTYEHIAECLRLTYATLFGAGPDFNPKVKLSLASLGELFALATNEAYHPREDKCPSIFHYLVDNAYWKQPMLASGWCPFQIKGISEKLRLQTMHFFTLLGQPAGDRSHERCDSDRCLAYQNDLASYQTKHISGCNCEHYLIDTKDLAEILESGSLPLLRIQTGNALSELSVEIVPSSLTSRYIAVSHVWADGLGNPFQNSLPRCQLEFLHETIKEYDVKLNSGADQDMLLWIDTLCCPVEPGKAKNTALASMKKTYLEATRVLVLDRSLRDHCSKTMDPVEACTRIILRSSIYMKGLASNIVNQIGTFASFPCEYEGDLREDLGTITDSLKNRSVSVPCDEPLLIANLLDLGVDDILKGPCPIADCANVGCNHSRIHRMWSLMPTAFRGIPRTIILYVGPRLSEPGFRWAPSTLLYNEPLNLPLWVRKREKREDTVGTSTHLLYPERTMGLTIDYTGRGIPTDRGLLVRFTGYSLSPASGVASNPWNVLGQKVAFLRNVDGVWFQISRRLPAEKDSFFSAKSFHEIVLEEGNLWIMYETISQANHPQSVQLALLVQLLSDEEGIKYVQSKLHISIMLLESPKQKLFEAAYESAKEVTRKLSMSRLAVKSDGESKESGAVVSSMPEKGTNDDDNMLYKVESSMLEHEIELFVIQNASQDIRALADAVSTDGDGIRLFKELIAKWVVGNYGYLGPTTTKEQEWCCD
ncbi:hypothetical protein BDR22DRAFT_818114 [Usnea florida]